MKVFVKFLAVSLGLTIIAGCASNTVYVPKVPSKVQAQLLDYYEQSDNKVFVLAVDPSGDYAFGVDSGKATLKEAAKVAVEMCDANRKSHGIFAKPYIYAINDKVVYEEMIHKAHGKDVTDEREAQKKELLKQDASSETAEQPVAEEPVAEEPVAEEPAAEEPAAEE